MSVILLTGSQGGIGRHLRVVLEAEGHRVRGLDVTPPSGSSADDRIADLRDLTAVRGAMSGIDTVVHAGALPNDRGDGLLVMEINVQGTWNVLQAAAEAGVRRVVCFSSINAQGSVHGLRPTEYLPIDDDYPHHPMTPYQLSKHLVEEMCRSFTESHDMVTLCLRPVWVTYPEMYAAEGFGTEAFLEKWRTPHWAYVDVRDVADAVLRCLRLEGQPHDAFLLSAADTSAGVETRTLLEREHPDVPWRGGDLDAYLADDPYRTLIDCRHAREVLDWEPRYRWRDTIAAGGEG